MSFLAQDNLTSLLPSSIPIALPLATEWASTSDNSSRPSSLSTNYLALTCEVSWERAPISSVSIAF